MKFRWETEFKETDIGEIPKDWEVTNFDNRNYFEILSSGIERFEGLKEYLSTSSVNGNKIVEIEELITYDKRPSRANMQPVENSVWLARMINSPKFLKADKDLIKNKILSTGFLGVKTKTNETCDYLFYYIQTKEFQEYKDGYVTGAVQESLTNESAKELIVILPPFSEQSRIATVLSWFDDLIENKEKQNEILEKTAMAIFKSWFVDFETFRDGEFVYNEELGKEIPKGWEVNPIEKEFYLIKGRKCELCDDYFEGYSPYLLIETFKTGKIEFWTSEKEPQVEENDVVLVADGESSGKVLRYQKGILGSTLLTLKPKRENYIELKHLIYLTLKFYEDEIMSHRTGSAIPHLDKEFLKSFLLLLPPSHILQSFHSFVEPLFQKIILNQKQIMNLKKVRDTFLPLLVFGKLRVEEI
jgi:type I restriction enzyme S subunit